MWIRPKRMQGKPGIWATEYQGGWTVYSLAGIVATGLTERAAKQQLEVTELQVVPVRKGEAWSLKNKQ